MQPNDTTNSVDDLLFIVEDFQLNWMPEQGYVSFSAQSEDDILEAADREQAAKEALLNTIKEHLSFKSNAYMLSLLNTTSLSGAPLFYLLDPPLVIPVIEIIENKLLSFIPQQQVDNLLLFSFKLGEQHSFLSLAGQSNNAMMKENYLYVFNRYLKKTIKDTSGLFKRNLLNNNTDIKPNS